jgi:hypothetical protein
MLCGVIPVSMFNPQQQTADERMTDVTSIPVSICDDADALLVEIESPPTVDNGGRLIGGPARLRHNFATETFRDCLRDGIKSTQFTYPWFHH